MSPLNTDDQPNWFFRLDELDLLEFDYATLLERHNGHRDWRRTIEEKVFAEQEAWEDQAEQDLERRLGDTSLTDHCSMHGEEDEELSISDMLSSLVAESQLASEAYGYFRALSRLSLSDEDQESYEAVFRLQVNAPLVPAKLAFATHEEAHEDPAALLIAEKELDMAYGYLSRVVESLTQLAAFERISQAEAGDLLKAGEDLLGRVRLKRDRVRKGIKFRRL